MSKVIKVMKVRGVMGQTGLGWYKNKFKHKHPSPVWPIVLAFVILPLIMELKLPTQFDEGCISSFKILHFYIVPQS